MNLSIIIPVYNEEKLVPLVLEKVLSVKMPEIIQRLEIVLVDDASTDHSFEVLETFIKNNNPQCFKLIKHEKNSGKGAAVKTGISISTGDVILIQDADLELSPQDIPLMIEVMNELNIDFVNGSRYLSGVFRPLSSYKRYIANKLFTLITSIIINVKLTDMACGYKLFKKDLYNKITLRENRFGFEAELIIKAIRLKKNNIAEVPVRYFPRNEGEGKKLKNSDGIKILGTIIRYGLLRSN